MTRGTQPPSKIFSVFEVKKGKIDDAEEPENAEGRRARPAELPAEDRKGEYVRAQKGAGDGDAVGPGQRVAGSEAEDEQDHADGQHGVHLGNVNLAFLGLGGVANFHAGEQAKLDALPGHGEGARDDGLARDDRREGGGMTSGSSSACGASL